MYSHIVQPNAGNHSQKTFLFGKIVVELQKTADILLVYSNNLNKPNENVVKRFKIKLNSSFGSFQHFNTMSTEDKRRQQDNTTLK